MRLLAVLPATHFRKGQESRYIHQATKTRHCVWKMYDEFLDTSTYIPTVVYGKDITHCVCEQQAGDGWQLSVLVAHIPDMLVEGVTYWILLVLYPPVYSSLLLDSYSAMPHFWLACFMCPCFVQCLHPQEQLLPPLLRACNVLLGAFPWVYTL